MMRAGFTVGLLAIVAGCPANPPGHSTDAGQGRDSGSGGARLLLSVQAELGDPNLRAGNRPKSASLLGITGLIVDLEDVRVIGDAAPGDSRTTLAEVSFDFPESDAECLSFDSVPPGIYSRVLARVVRYRIDGRIEESGVEYSFSIEDTPPFTMSAMVDTDDVLVDVGRDGAIGIELAPERLVDAIDWDAEQADASGHFEIDGNSASIESVRDALLEFFQPHEPTIVGECAPET